MDNKKTKFVDEWVETLDPHRASIALVGRKRAKREETYKALKKPEIQKAVSERNNFLDDLYKIKRHHLTRLMLAITNFDKRNLYGDDGNIKHPKEWTFDEQLAVSEFTEDVTILPSGSTRRTFKVKSYSLTQATKILHELNRQFIDASQDEAVDEEKQVSEQILEKINEIRKRKHENLSAIKVEMDFNKEDEQ